MGFEPPVAAPGDELAALKSQAQWLKSQLDAISKRVEELEKET
jgi:ubiquinone biosynthesis protein UbiJ